MLIVNKVVGFRASLLDCRAHVETYISSYINLKKKKKTACSFFALLSRFISALRILLCYVKKLQHSIYVVIHTITNVIYFLYLCYILMYSRVKFFSVAQICQFYAKIDLLRRCCMYICTMNIWLQRKHYDRTPKKLDSLDAKYVSRHIYILINNKRSVNAIAWIIIKTNVNNSRVVIVSLLFWHWKGLI